MILFSVLIPVFNTGKYLQRCFDSVLNQTYENWEAIVVDDGSTDINTIFLCDSYAEKDFRFRVIHKENEGLLLTRRRAMREARGDFFCFLDSDDYWNKKLLSKVHDCIQNTKSDMVIFRYRRMGTRRNAASPKIFAVRTVITQETKYKLLDSITSGYKMNNLCLKAVRRDIVDIENDYTTYKNVQNGEDLLQSIPMVENAKKICFINDVLYYYCNNPTSITRQEKSDEKFYKLYEDLTIVQKELLNYLERNFEQKDYIGKFYISLIKYRIHFTENYCKFQKDNLQIRKYATLTLRDKIIQDAADLVHENNFHFQNRKLIRLLKKDKLYDYILNKVDKG